MTQSTLGRGLSSLIPARNIKENLNNKEVAGPKEEIYEIEVDKIQPNPRQPRQDFEKSSLDELVSSIKIHGLIQPLIIFKTKDGYQLIAGERRWRAAKLLKLKKVPVVIRSVSDQEKLELALVENVQRKNLNPIERAYGYQRLADEFNLTQEEIGNKVSQSRASVANSLRLLSLPVEMQKALQAGKLSEGHAKVLLGVQSAEERQRIFKEVQRGNLSVRKTEHQVRQVTVKKRTQRRLSDPNMLDKEEALQQTLGTKVEIKKKGTQGTINIHFYSGEELQEIIKKIVK